MFLQNVGGMNSVVALPLQLWTILIVGVAIILTVRTSAKHATELFLLWFLTYFLMYKHVWEHQYVMLLPVFVILYWLIEQRGDRSSVSRRVFWWTFAVIAAPTLFIALDRATGFVDPEFSWSFAESLLYHFPKPVAVLTLYGTLAVWLWRFGKTPYREKVMSQPAISEAESP
jgi:hypothetical protein